MSLPAGCLRMPVARFTALTVIGSAIWNTALIGRGWALGRNYEAIGAAVSGASRVLLVTLAFLTVAAVVRWRRRVAR